MPFFTYILYSQQYNKHYYGSCSNLEVRLKNHNAGKVRSTKAYRPYEVKYFEQYETKTEALQREKFFKSIDGYRFLKEKGII
jgi:putative endonuclease